MNKEEFESYWYGETPESFAEWLASHNDAVEPQFFAEWLALREDSINEAAA
jgi:hypothetical protein